MHPSISRFLCCVLALGFGSGCQEYEFQPLAPVTFRETIESRKIVSRQFKPNLMFVIDRSQSMNFDMDNGTSRWTQLKQAMGTYLTVHGTVARMGLVTFPVDEACGAGRVVVDLWTQNDDPNDLQAQASRINQQIQGTVPGGVTPVADTLRALGSYAPLESGRENVVVVATDGLPNCNANNPNSYDVDPAACDCSFSPLSQCSGVNARLGCLDKSGTVSVVRELRTKGIKTAVVGFGADALEGVGPMVLNAIASEGGAPRTCPNGTDAECGSSNACDRTTGVCQMRYYQAATGAELAEALTAIGYDLSKGEACKFHLEGAPSDGTHLGVRIDGQAVPRGSATWDLDAAGVVTFTGASCQRLANSTPDDPANVEFHTLSIL